MRSNTQEPLLYHLAQTAPVGGGVGIVLVPAVLPRIFLSAILRYPNIIILTNKVVAAFPASQSWGFGEIRSALVKRAVMETVLCATGRTSLGPVERRDYVRVHCFSRGGHGCGRAEGTQDRPKHSNYCTGRGEWGWFGWVRHGTPYGTFPLVHRIQTSRQSSLWQNT